MTTTLNLKDLATKAIVDCDPEDYVDQIHNAIRKPVREFIDQLLAEEGVPESGSGWQIGDIELLLVKRDAGYVPSVRSPELDAPASTYGEGTEEEDPAEALTFGLSDALAYELAAELSPEDEDEE
jgi:hypothetical protein